MAGPIISWLGKLAVASGITLEACCFPGSRHVYEVINQGPISTEYLKAGQSARGLQSNALLINTKSKKFELTPCSTKTCQPICSYKVK